MINIYDRQVAISGGTLHHLGLLMQASERKEVALRRVGWQDGFGTLPGRMLYNVVSGDYEHGSTVTLETMQARGYKITIVN